MKHVGDITKLDGSTLEPVDCICGGSPCQDLSVAGKRAGLAGERSGLFMEQIRIVKEMRAHDIANGASPATARPRFMVWENVPGSFSSNHGEDFQAVLSKIIKVADPDAPDVPLPPKGKWPMADAYYGDGWSVAYRVHDAQFWGVPQRRKRVSVVADFGGLAAPEVSFEREGVSRDPEPGATPWQEAPGNAGEGAQSAGAEGNFGVIANTLTRRADGSPQPGIGSGANVVLCGNPWDTQSQRVYEGDGAWHSLNANDSGGQSRDAIVQEDPTYCLQGNGIDRADTAGCNGRGWCKDVSYTLNTIDRPAVLPPTAYCLDQQGGKGSANYTEDVTPTMLSDSHGTPHAVAYSFDSLASNSMKSNNPHSGCRSVETAKTLDTTSPDPSKNQGGVAVVQAADLYNGTLTGDTAVTLNANSGLSANHAGPTVLAAGFSFGQSAKARSIGYEEEVSPTLRGGEGGNQKPCAVVEPVVLESNQNHATTSQSGVCTTLPASMGMGGGYVPMITEPLMIEMTSTKNTVIEDGVSCTLTARMGTGGNQVNAVMDEQGTYQKVTGTLNPGAHPGSYNGQDAYNDMLVTGTFQNTGQGWWNESDVGATVRTACGGDSVKANLVAAVDCRNGVENTDVNGTLQAKEQGTNVNSNNVCRTGSVVRRLTPLECERLQGYPDGWTDIGEWTDTNGKKHKEADTPRYKALGNSIALPFWYWLLGRISAQYGDHTPTLGSLFDGIGGFPLCWEAHNGKGTARWASEIEEFPIAVTKIHFPEPELPDWLM